MVYGSSDPAANANIDSIANTFADATPALLVERELLSRIDTKYIVPVAAITDVLSGLDHAYAALRPAGEAWPLYQSLYLDTPDLRCFHDHRRGRRVRHKIRVRHYAARGLSFLEVKTKRNELVTDKRRCQLRYGDEDLTAPERGFLRQHAGALADELSPVLQMNYHRLSLIGIAAHERVTVDIGMECMARTGETSSLGPIAIVEIKRASLAVVSPTAERLAEAGHRARSISKYIAAVVRLTPHVRHNRLLPTLRAAERIAR